MYSANVWLFHRGAHKSVYMIADDREQPQLERNANMLNCREKKVLKIIPNLYAIFNNWIKYLDGWPGSRLPQSKFVAPHTSCRLLKSVYNSILLASPIILANYFNANESKYYLLPLQINYHHSIHRKTYLFQYTSYHIDFPKNAFVILTGRQIK